jgi:hypothetical protein
MIQAKLSNKSESTADTDKKRDSLNSKFNFDFAEIPTEGNEEGYSQPPSRINSEMLTKYHSMASPFADLSRATFGTVDFKSPKVISNEKQNGDLTI